MIRPNKVIDVHNHHVPIGVIKEIKSNPEKYGVEFKTGNEGSYFEFPYGKSGIIFDTLTNIEATLAHLKELGITNAILSTWVDIYGYGLEEKKLTELSRLINDEFVKISKRFPDHIKAVATLPLPYGEAASEELKRAVEEGLVGAMIGTNVLGMDLSEKFMEPVWYMAEKLNVPIILHPMTLRIDKRLDDFYLRNLIGNPLDTTIAASKLIFEGVLEKHPRLKIILVHGGGYLPYAIGRLNHGFKVRKEAKEKLNDMPEKYLRSFYYDTIVYKELALRFLIDSVGSDRVVLGTDYPFDMELPNPVQFISSVTKNEDELKNILYNNVISIFNFS